MDGPRSRVEAVARLLLYAACLAVPVRASVGQVDQLVRIESDGWILVGNLLVPGVHEPPPAVLMLNQAAGNREAYDRLARELASRGIGSLRLDLRGHGESTNLGPFVPGELSMDPKIWDAERDIIAALGFLKQNPNIDSTRIAVVGASYSGEEMAEAGRLSGYEDAYVALSPGSFSDDSIGGMDASGQPWLFVVSAEERFLQEITAEVRSRSRTVELIILPGSAHATDLLSAHPSLPARIAVWLETVLLGA